MDHWNLLDKLRVKSISFSLRLFSFSTANDLLSIGFSEKLHKQQQVAGQNSDAKVSGCVGAMTVRESKVLEWKGRSKDVLVVCGNHHIHAKEDHKQIDDELSNLESGQMFFPPNFLGRDRGTRVVVIHDDMDGEVERNRNPRLKVSIERKNRINFTHTTEVLPTNCV